MSTKKRKATYTPPPNETVNKRERVTRSQARRRGNQTPRGGGRYRVPQPATWRAEFRLAPIIYIAFAVFQYMLVNVGTKTELTGSERILNAMFVAAVMTAVFLPMDYLMKKSRYRSYHKRIERDSERQQ